MVQNSVIPLMVSLHLDSFLLDFPLDWNEKMTLSIILFAAGLLCLITAILLGIYLIKSDRFTSQPSKEQYPSYTDFEEESRLSRAKSKIGSFFGRIKGVFKRSKDEYELPEEETLKTTPDEPAEPSEEEPTSSDEEPLT